MKPLEVYFEMIRHTIRGRSLRLFDNPKSVRSDPKDNDSSLLLCRFQSEQSKTKMFSDCELSESEFSVWYFIGLVKS